MRKRSMAGIIAVCAALAVFAGCGNNAASTTTTTTTAATTAATTTEATTTTTPAQTEAATEADEGELNSTAALFTKGVWLAHKDSFEGEPVQYFVFTDETSGHTESVDGIGGVPFACEQNGVNIMFHFGDAEDNTPAVFDLGEITGTFDYGDGNTATYFFEFKPDLDPDTFTVEVSDDGPVTSGALFKKGVWLAHKDNFEGEPVQYFVFNDETSGHTESVDGMGGVPFSCEQNGVNIMFHFGSADDNTPAVFEPGDATGTFDYGNGNTATYFFEFKADLDPDTFTVEASDEGLGNIGTLFTKGVWLARKDSFEGEPVQYFVFMDETSGHTESVDGIGGVPFACEQNGVNILFHFGDADNNTPAVFDLGEITGTFDYGDGNTATYFFEHTEYDADTFDAAALLN